MSNPLENLAVAQMFAISMELEAQLAQTKGYRPVVAMLQIAKNEAAGALIALVHTDPLKPELVRTRQYEVARFEQLCTWIKQVIAQGKEADHLLSAKEREELMDTLLETDEGEDEAVQAGLITREGTYANEQG